MNEYNLCKMSPFIKEIDIFIKNDIISVSVTYLYDIDIKFLRPKLVNSWYTKMYNCIYIETDNYRYKLYHYYKTVLIDFINHHIIPFIDTQLCIQKKMICSILNKHIIQDLSNICCEYISLDITNSIDKSWNIYYNYVTKNLNIILLYLNKYLQYNEFLDLLNTSQLIWKFCIIDRYKNNYDNIKNSIPMKLLKGLISKYEDEKELNERIKNSMNDVSIFLPEKYIY